MKSKTPRTDELRDIARNFAHDCEVVPASLAVEIETELENVKSKLERAVELLNGK